MSELTEAQRALLVGPDARMDGYYIGFDKTGNELIDQILSAVAYAAKGAHSTDAWGDELEYAYGPLPAGKTLEWLIQEAANDAAERLSAAGVTQPEPEYEYAMEDDLGMSFARDRRDAERHASFQRKEYHPRVVRRVKAGAWEPVPNQSDGSEA